MKEFDKQMTHTIKGMLENYEAEYTPQAWDKLTQNLDAIQPPSSSKKKWWWFGIIGFLLFPNFFMMKYLSSDDSEQSIHENQSIQYIHKMKKNESSQFTSEDSSTSLISLPSQVKQIDQVFSSDSKNAKSSIIPSNPESSNSLAFDRVDFEDIRFLNAHPINHLLVPDCAINLLKDISFSHSLVFEKTSTQKRIKRKNKLRIELPHISFSKKNNQFYKKFLGPNKLIAYWNPEIHKSGMFKQSTLSSGLGIELEGPLSNQLKVSVGLALQTNLLSEITSVEELNENLQIKDPTEYAESELNQFIPLEDSVINRTADYQFLEIPITLKLNVLRNDHSNVNVRCGLSALFYLKETYKLPFLMEPDFVPYEETTSFESFGNIQLLGSVNLGLGYQYQFSDRLALSSSFDYKLGLSKSGDYLGKLNRMSFKAGLFFRFGRKD